MQFRYQGEVLAGLEEIDVDDLGIRWLEAAPGVNRVLDFDLPLDTRLEPSRDSGP